MSLRDAIRQIALSGMELYCKVCKVDAVDEQARTVDCSPLDETAPLLGVNLQANQDGEDGFVQFPAVGSYVAVSFVSESVAVVVLMEKIDKIVLKIGETTAEIVDGQVDIATGDIKVQMTEEAITFNDGGNGGLVIGQKAADKLNTLENDLNMLKSIFATWVPAPTDGGAALKTAAAAWAGQQLTTTVVADLENDKVKQ